jgi:hypothetical protein
LEIIMANLRMAVILVAVTLPLAAAVSPPAAQAALQSGCISTPFGTLPVTSPGGGAYTFQLNEYNSSAAETACTTGSTEFTVSASSIDVPTDGAPGAYTSIYRGCHWGDCTSDSGYPLAVSAVEKPGTVTFSEKSTEPGAPVAYDNSFDVFYTPTPGGEQTGTHTEMMIWEDDAGGVQPAGTKVATHVKVGNSDYDIWYADNSPSDIVSYVADTAHGSLKDLNLGAFAKNAVGLGYLNSAWYLIDTEFGFELWENGAGAAVKSLEMCTPAGC